MRCEQNTDHAADVYAIDPRPGGWGGRYCAGCAKALRFQVTDWLTVPRNVGWCPACGEHDARLCDCLPDGRTRLATSKDDPYRAEMVLVQPTIRQYFDAHGHEGWAYIDIARTDLADTAFDYYVEVRGLAEEQAERRAEAFAGRVA
jgi:hypothetical protein